MLDRYTAGWRHSPFILLTLYWRVNLIDMSIDTKVMPGHAIICEWLLGLGWDKTDEALSHWGDGDLSGLLVPP